MNDRTLQLARSYVFITMAFLPSLFFIRIYELIKLLSRYTLSSSSWSAICLGTGLDLLVFLTFAGICGILFFLVSLICRRAAMVIYTGILFLVTIMYFLLVAYFTVTLIPLDHVIFSYSGGEIWHIVSSSARIDLLGILVFLLLISFPLFLLFRLKKVRFGIGFIRIFAAILVGATCVLSMVHLTREQFVRKFDFFLASNLFHYGTYAICNHSPDAQKPKSVTFEYGDDVENAKTNSHSKEVALKYQSLNRGFVYLNPDYPLYRVDNTANVLGRFFNLKPDKPNLVFIIVESLSPSFCGIDPYYGSFMPFLDSLKQRSLYWDNMFATSERTFGVFPAIFGSLPFTRSWNKSAGVFPAHFSLIRYMKENGYHSNFFYGGDPTLSNYEGFLRREGLDYSLGSFGESYRESKILNKRFRWGYPDGDLFRRSFEILDSFPNSPRLDIYLTLSMHDPFTVPNQEKYQQRVIERNNLTGPGEIFSSILYTDEMLRDFFDAYQKRPEYDNTIFIITGDHAMPELQTTWKIPPEKYRVPLIIFSPLLNESRIFKAYTSHLDITPSLLALLRLPYSLNVKPACHWLGSELALDQPPDHPLGFAFTRNNRSQPDYFRYPYFLSFNLLYKLDKEGQFVEESDSSRIRELQEEQKLLQEASQFATDNDALIPASGWFQDDMEYAEITPAINRFHQQSNEEYIGIFTSRFQRDFQSIELDIKFLFKARQPDSVKLPPLVIEITDTAGTSQLYVPFRLENDFVVRQVGSGWTSYRIISKLDLGFISDTRNNRIKTYLWNSRRADVSLDSLRVKANGFYDSESGIDQ